MVNNSNQPRDYDAVLGGENCPKDGLVLGGLEGAKQRFTSNSEQYRIIALSQFIDKGEEGLEFVIKALKDPSEKVKLAAYKLLINISDTRVRQAIIEFNPYQYFRCIYTIPFCYHGRIATIGIHPQRKTIMLCADGYGDYLDSEDEMIIDTCDYYYEAYIDIKEWDLETGNNIQNRSKIFGEKSSNELGYDFFHQIYSMTLSSDAQILAVGGSYNRNSIGKIVLYDIMTNQIIRVLTTQPDTSYCISVLAINQDTTILASGDKNSLIIVWDLKEGREIYTITEHSKEITSLAITPDGTKLISTSFDKTIRIWDLNTGKRISCIEGLAYPILAVAISPDGQTFVTDYNNNIKIWDLVTAKEIHNWSFWENVIDSLSISFDGKILVSCGDQQMGNEIKVWELARELLAIMKENNERINAYSAVISQDGQTIVSYGDDGVKVWRVP